MLDKLYHRANLHSSFKLIHCALCCGDTALCLQSCHTPNNREIYSLKALLCTRMAFPLTTREPEMDLDIVV